MEIKKISADAAQAEKAFADKRKMLLEYEAHRERSVTDHFYGDRIRDLADAGSFEEMDADLATSDPISFPDYEDKLVKERAVNKAADSLLSGRARVEGIPVVCAQLNKSFLMGSMGIVAGEKIARAAQAAQDDRLPLIIFSASGGARMQEGLFSLFQMAKTAAAIDRFKRSGGLFISVLTHPTTGGVSASFASLGDIILAEPGALIGFAGPRVIEQTIGEKLPKGFQRAEFQLKHGFVDRIVPRDQMKKTIARLLRLHGYGDQQASAENAGGERPAGVQAKAGVNAWDRVMAARSMDRPRNSAFIEKIFDSFTELHGDRLGADDPAIVGGIALLGGRPVTVIAHKKGRSAAENISCNFGMPGPEGYGKALRLMEQAEKFGRPVITLIDTPGAYPGREAEENGQSAAIAENLARMSSLSVPVISIVTGEGNSGGALAIGVCDSLWMLENAVYSVLSPEGFSSILWKDSSRARQACDIMRLTAPELLADGLIDQLIPEPGEGIAKGFDKLCKDIKIRLEAETGRLLAIDPSQLVRERYERWRHFEGSKGWR